MLIAKLFSTLQRALSSKRVNARRQRHAVKYSTEVLEDRWVPANIAVTGAFLYNGQGTQITAPVLGERLYVRVTYDTQDLPADASYNLRFAVDGVPLTFTAITSGAGLTSGSWFYTRTGWFAESLGTHTATVTVDSTDTILETNEADNSASINFTPVRATLPAKFSWPEDGIPMQDSSFGNYVDLDPTAGIRDWAGGTASYDGHQGLDFGGPTNATLDSGKLVRAAAPGTVIAADDFNYDRNKGSLGNIVPGGAPNYVAIDHGGGWVTYYYHLRRDSVAVKVGDVVDRGDVLGFEGSSGNSTGSHLHFGVTHNGADVETFLDPTTYWIDPLPYVGAASYLTDFGITNIDPTSTLLDGERTSDVSVFSQDPTQTIYAWGTYSGLRQGDQIQAIYRRPDGSNLGINSLTIPADYSGSVWYFGRGIGASPVVGLWSVEFRINGTLAGVKTFNVTAAGAPEIRIQDSTGSQVLDERYTPYSFGSVSQGGTIPTQTFTVFNHGSAPLLISGIDLPIGYTLVEGLPNSLAPGAQNDFTVGMNTAAAGYYGGQIRVNSNDTSEAEYNFSVEGQVTSGTPFLLLGISRRRAVEGTQILANIRRSGGIAQPLTVNLQTTDATGATAPLTVIIPANRSSVQFYLTAVSDGRVDAPQIITVTASSSGYTSARNTLDVLDVSYSNTPPLLENYVPDQNVTEDVPFAFTFPANQFVEADYWDTLTYSATLANLTPLPAWVTFNPATRRFSGTPTNSDVGTITVRLTATDGTGAAVSDSFDITVINVNDGPIIANPIPDLIATEDTPFNFTIPQNAFFDVDVGDTLSYVAVLGSGLPLPAWLTFTPATRTFSGTPTDAEIGTIIVRVTATDGSLVSISDLFNIVVVNSNDAPTVANTVPDRTATEDIPFTFTFAANTFADIDVGDLLTYSATRSDGTPLPGWLTLNSTTRTFSGTPLNANVGTLSVRLIATDVAGASASDVFDIVVANTNDAPTVANPIPDQTVTELVPLSFTFAANTFAEIDVGDSLTYTATRPDGSALPAWLIFTPATRSFTGTPQHSDIGTVVVRVTARDGSNAPANDTFNIAVVRINSAPTVANPVPDQTAPEDAVFSFSFAANTFADVDAGEVLTYSATKADGTALPAWLTFTPSTRTFSGTPLNGDVGTVTVKLTATDQINATVSDTFNIVVTNTNDAPTLVTFLPDRTATEDVALSFAFSATTFADVDVGDALTYSATRADGSALPAWLTFTPATRTFSGMPQNADVGTVSVRVTATDMGNASVSDTFDIVVSNINDAPTLEIPISDRLATEDLPFTLTFPANTFAEVDAGDSLTYSATLADGSPLPSWLVLSNNTRTFAGTPRNADVGSLSVKLTATDKSSASASSTFTITVLNINDPPVVANLIPDRTATQDVPFSFTFAANTFADIDAGDALTYSATRADGTALPSWLTFSAGTRTFSGTPLNAHVGTLSIRVTATDSGNVPVSDTFEIVVNNVNDAPTNLNLSNAAIAENQASGTLIGSFTSTDPDVGDSFTYSLVAGDGSTDNGRFTISNGQLLTAASFDFETQNVYSIRVATTDLNGLQLEKQFTINVTNLNDPPTNIDLDAASIAENLPSGTIVGTFSSTDQDTGNTFLYTLVSGTGSADNNAFTILNGQLVTAVSFNFETKSTYFVRVRSTDQNLAAVEKSFTISVTNVNEAPTGINLSATSIAENLPGGTPVGNLSTLDQDAGNTFTYTLVPGSGSADNGSFSISNGQLLTNSSLNFEAKSSYAIRVRTTDQNNLTFEKAFTISVTDANEPPSIVANQSFHVTENSAANTVIGTVLSVDDDLSSPFNKRNFSITSGNATNAFAINSSTGQLTINNPALFDFETTQSFSLLIALTDGGGATAAPTPVTIRVDNVNENPTLTNIGSQLVGEDAVTGSLAFTIGDPETAATDLLVQATSSNPGLVPNANLLLSGTGASRSLVIVPLANQSGTATITVTVSDGTNSTARSFELTVLPNNDAPTLTSFAPQAIQEHESTPPLLFTIGDTDNAISSLTVVATSSNPGLVPDGNIVLEGAGANRTLTASAVANRSGTAVITVTVSDGFLSTSQQLVLTVLAVDDPPVMSIATQPLKYKIGSNQFVAVDSTATFHDPDTVDLNFNGAVLKVSGHAAKDQISILKAERISRKGKHVLFDGSSIGTITGGKKGVPLTVNLTGFATQTAVQSLLRAIGFKSVDKVAGERTLTIELTNVGGIDMPPLTRVIQVEA